MYYDRLFNEMGLRIIKEGRFNWRQNGKVVKGYEINDAMEEKIYYNRTYFWIVS